MEQPVDLYENLQVHPSTHPDVIEAACRRLDPLCHPDCNAQQGATEWRNLYPAISAMVLV